MKTGDLVKMKYEMWWKIRASGQARARDYTEECGIIYGVAGRGIKVLMPDNTVRLGLVEEWEIINAK